MICEDLAMAIEMISTKPLAAALQGVFDSFAKASRALVFLLASVLPRELCFDLWPELVNSSRKWMLV
jgi:hypothetical protein